MSFETKRQLLLQLRASTEVQRPPMDVQALSDVHPQVVLSASRPPQ